MSAPKLVFAHGKRVAPTRRTRSQRAAHQLTFPVYFSSGFVANLQRALDQRSNELTGKQRQRMRQAIRAADQIVDLLRENLED